MIIPTEAAIPAPQLAQSYATGVGLLQKDQQLAAEVQLKREQLAQEANQAQLAASLKQQQLQMESMKAAQALEVEKSYQQQSLALKSQALDMEQQKNEADAMAAAREFQANNDMSPIRARAILDPTGNATNLMGVPTGKGGIYAPQSIEQNSSVKSQPIENFPGMMQVGNRVMPSPDLAKANKIEKQIDAIDESLNRLPYQLSPEQQSRRDKLAGELEQLQMKIDGGQTGKSASKNQEQRPVAIPSDAAINHLLSNPSLADQFDAKYGAGASKQYLR